MDIEEIEGKIEILKVLDSVHTKMGGEPSETIRMFDLLLSHIKELEELIEKKEEQKQYWAKACKEAQEYRDRNALFLKEAEARIKELEELLSIKDDWLVLKDRLIEKHKLRAEQPETRIKELEAELSKIKADPSIGKLTVDEWPETPDD
jgi:chromosome segregation ATPase